MSYCLNLRCQKPQNPSNARFCSTCGSRLLLGDRYRALQPISQGGIGRTFLAVDEQESSKPRCIIKQFSLKNQGTNNAEKAAESFRQEAVRLQELGQHPQIPQLLACFEQDDRTGIPAALVQTYIEGESLAQTLEAEGVFSETQIRQILNELLPVLQFVHDYGVIHRDINPNNIIRRSPTTAFPYQGRSFSEEVGGSQLVLVDFGAAKFTTKTALARTGTVIGSAAYTAQEQLRGKAVTSSDLYSLGVTCIHLLTHIHPFDLFNSLEGLWVWQDYLTNPVSKELSQILNKMLADAVKHRYQSAEEILKDLNPQADPKTLVQSTKFTTSSPPTAPKALNPTWNCVRTLTGHLSSISSIAFSPDGQTIASGSSNQVSGKPDGVIKVWQVSTRQEISTLTANDSFCVISVAFSPDGQTIASGNADKTIKIWQLSTGRELGTLRGHTKEVVSVAFSRDGQTLASGSVDKTIKIWRRD